MNRAQGMFDAMGSVKQYKSIKITSKRQVTIPKSFFDHLGIEESVQAYLTDEGIFLKPIRHEKTIYQKDTQSIVKNVLKEGLSEDETAYEISRRIEAYDTLLDKRIQEFMDDLGDAGVPIEEGEINDNGLDIFFDEQNGEASEKN